jgi:hypothetical protein
LTLLYKPYPVLNHPGRGFLVLKGVRTARAILGTLLLAAGMLPAQPGARSARGTVAALKPEQAAFDLRLDGGGGATVLLSTNTVLQRIAPGETDLRNARPMQAAELAVGDRVLVTWVEGMEEARRVVVMGADEIARRREQERPDWQKRGVAGVVDSVRQDTILLRARSFSGEKIYTVHVTPKTVFRRYKPDSVKFADALPSSLSEVKKGDQLRARGEKSADGMTVTAEEAVFGTFTTRAGTVIAIDAARGEIRLKDLDTGKPLLVRTGADTQVKRMPEFAARPGGLAGPAGAGGMRAGGPPAATGAGAPDVNQMVGRMPAARIEDLKPGETVVVSSTRGESRDVVTAILLLGNAGRLVEMAAAQQQRQAGMQGMRGGGLEAGMNGGALGGLELPGMLP